MTIVFFNGPPQAGKDTAVNELLKVVPGSMSHKFSKPLKDCFRAVFAGLDELLIENLLEKYKDIEDVQSFGNWRTPRGFQIALSEKFIKQALGKDAFGKLAVLKLRAVGRVQHVFFSDSGFAEECVPVIKHFGRENCHLVIVKREGASFDNDSRSYIELDLPSRNKHEYVNKFDKKEEPELFRGSLKILWQKIKGEN